MLLQGSYTENPKNKSGILEQSRHVHKNKNNGHGWYYCVDVYLG